MIFSMTNSRKQIVVAVSGLKNSGKTTLIEKLVIFIRQKGYTVATVKHDGHTFQPDREGTDSYRFFQAGANTSVVYDAEKISFVKRCSVDLDKLLSDLEEDFVLLEGFKYSDFPKLLIQRDEEWLPLDESTIALVLKSKSEETYRCPCFLRDDVEAIGQWLINYRKERCDRV